jgi:predicted RNA-binding protein YlxR (DUF448 family)
MKASLRTCIGCLKKKPKDQLVRLVLRDGQVTSVLTNQAKGRGTYLCQNGQGIKKTCLKKADEKNQFKKAFKTNQINLENLGG